MVAPAEVHRASTGQPLLVRPVFGLLAALVLPFSEMFTGTIPVVLVLLGLLMGTATALAVAVLWEYFPEEEVR